MKNLILILLLIGQVVTLAAQLNCSADRIPANLRANADLVVRQFDLKFEVLNEGEAIETEHKVLTLLNEDASDELEQVFIYDQIHKIVDVEGALYDSNGKQVRKIKKKDIVDFKAYEQSIDDNRFKQIKFPRLPYPFTIEYTVVRKHNGLMLYTDFFPQHSSHESVESASLEIILPPKFEIRIFESNLPEQSKKDPLHWSFHHLPAFKIESYTPAESIPYPRVLCAPKRFRIENYSGDMSTWESFGKFMETLHSGKGNLPTATVDKLKQMTAECRDTRCKVERVYAYLQQNTRYFSIQLGIGGWQPTPAESVDELKYSDCKGLSNYMVAMLQAVGVPAYYALVYSGGNVRYYPLPTFPNASSFNHAIACVPMPNDTIWLECTDQTISCGFLSNFTDNRPALLITPEGGKLVQTPVYNEKSNTIRQITHMTLSADGNAVLHSEDTFRGIASNTMAQLKEESAEERKKALYELLSLSDFEIKSFDIKLQKGLVPEVTRSIALNVPKFAATSGKRLFVPVVALTSKMMPPEKDSIRVFPIQAASRGFSMESHLTITLPEGYTVEHSIDPLEYHSPFGHYELSIQEEARQLVVYRKLTLNNSIQPKEAFEVFLTFFRNIAKADKTKVVLTKGT